MEAWVSMSGVMCGEGGQRPPPAVAGGLNNLLGGSSDALMSGGLGHG